MFTLCLAGLFYFKEEYLNPLVYVIGGLLGIVLLLAGVDLCFSNIKTEEEADEWD